MKCVFNRVVDVKETTNTVLNLESNTLFIYDYISSYNWGESDTNVSASSFLEELRKVSGDITVRINSKGGEVGNALAIYQLLREHKGKVTTVVDGYAYSCAAWILLAGEERFINTGGIVMVHNPCMYVEMDEENCLEEYLPQWLAHRDSIAAIISERTGMKNEDAVGLMKEQTFMTAKQAVDNKFCTSIRSNSASIPNGVSNCLPDKLKEAFKETTPNYSSLVQRSLLAVSNSMFLNKRILN